MKALRDRLTGPNSRDSGLTLVEVIVAMMIFSIVALGVGYSLVMVLKMTNDARGKQTATNLAAAEIDTSRAAATLAALTSHTKTVTVDDRDYRVAVSTLWTSTIGGSDGLCSSGTGALLFKRVHVSVTWEGMSPGTSPVVTDTIVAPPVRVNAADKGAIVVAVNNVTGAGNAGLTISAVPSVITGNTASALTVTPSPTDAQGCGVILQVTPGTYDVSISRPGGVPASLDIMQQTNPVVRVAVAAGSSITAPFQYDVAGIFTLKYASNYTLGTAIVPPSMEKSFVSANSVYVSTAAAPFLLHPFPGGYTVLAGKLAESGSSAITCSSVDPGAWLETTVDGVALAGLRQPAVAALPGLPSVPIVTNVPMGVVKITDIKSSEPYIKAVAMTTGPAGYGDPGCAAPSTYRFGPLTGDSTIALPFGTWTLTKGNSTKQTSNVGDKNVELKTRGLVRPVSGTSIVTLDPRTPVTP